MIDLEAPTANEVLEQLRACCQALDDKKASEIKVLCLKNCSTVTDYFVIATGNSEPNLRALSREVIHRLDDLQVETTHTNPTNGTGWAVVDAYDIIVHVFTKEVRQFYNLEGLWRDAEIIDVSNWITPEPAYATV